jgi:sugar phosphate permease
MAVCVIMFAICTFFYGSVNQLWLFGAIVILLSVLDTSQNGIAMQTIISRWFPRKKGYVMGIATIGLNVSTVIFLPFFTMLNLQFGIETAYRIIGGIALVIGIICIVVVRDIPEEIGLSPDNDSTESSEKLEAEAAKVKEFIKESPWTIKKVVSTKETWMISIMLGIGMMTATGVLTQFVPRMLSMGMSMTVAVSILSISGIGGMPFSYFWGWLDAKIGPKKVASILMAWYATALIILILIGENLVLNYLAVFLFCAALGGINNMFTSYTTSVFGRYDFANANRVMYPIYTAMRCSAFLIIGVTVAASGGYTQAYVIFAVLCVVGFVISLFTKDQMIGRSKMP